MVPPVSKSASVIASSTIGSSVNRSIRPVFIWVFPEFPPSPSQLRYAAESSWLFDKGTVIILGYVVFTIQIGDRKSTRLNSSHTVISYAVFFLKKRDKKEKKQHCVRCTRATVHVPPT